MRFGLVYDFRNPAQWRKPWAEVYASLMDQIAFADELGFDSIWLTEHHFVEDGYTPSPVPLMAAIAARTKRVQISTDILILPLYHPVKLAEDIATVDVLSNGRAMLGVGSGYRDAEFAAFGTSRKERASRMEEGVAVLRGCWADGPFSFAGRHFRVTEIARTATQSRTPSLLAVERRCSPMRAVPSGMCSLRSVQRDTATLECRVVPSGSDVVKTIDDQTVRADLRRATRIAR